jgi:hypothetical protein
MPADQPSITADRSQLPAISNYPGSHSVPLALRGDRYFTMARKAGMRPDLADTTAPLPVVPSDPGPPTIVLLEPVFFDDGARRRRLIGRGRFLAAAASVAYLGMLGVSVTALPVIKPGIARPVSAAVTPTTPAPPAAAPVPRPAAKAHTVVDQDAPLVLRLVAPVTTRATPPSPTTTTRPHHDDKTPSTAAAPTTTNKPTTTKKHAAK